ncbi:MAG: hypothetical protein ABIN67_24915 [Ferruginibacter sp.]
MKSLLLSFLLTAAICIYFMFIVDPKFSANVRAVPNWVLIAVVVIIFAGYLLALYWGITGIFKQQRIFNLAGIGFSLFGIGVYAFFFVLSGGKGKESKGQFDHELGKIEINQRTVVDNLLHQTNTKTENVAMVAYWEMHENPDEFVLCVQKGNVIAMQVKNKPVTDIAVVSKLSNLNWLSLENCDLKTIAVLDLPKLEHLSVEHNQLASLDGLQNSPLVYWLNFKDNPVTDSTALKSLTNKYVYIAK